MIEALDSKADPMAYRHTHQLTSGCGDMAYYQTGSSRSSGWMQAVIFNSLLIILPVVAARIVIMAFSVQGFNANPTAEAIAETRQAIDLALEDLAPRGSDQRSYWADLVDRELRARDLSAARGFLLAAPQMLDGADVRAVRAAAEADPSGTEDQRIASAAILFLPNDVRARYEEAIRPPSIPMPEPTDADTESAAADVTGANTQTASASQAPVTPARFSASSGFSMMGTFADLADQSRDWVRNEPTDSFLLRLTGLGMTATSMRDTPVDIALAASIIKAAYRAGRLHTSYQRVLSQRLNSVLSEDVLRPKLAAILTEIEPRAVAGEKVRTALVESIQQDHLPRLEEDFVQINRIADITNPTGAIALIEYARTTEDIRRARLIAEAGGDRATALAKQLGPETLDLARTGMKWSRLLILQIMGLAAIAMAMIWTVVSTLSRSFSRSPRPAALI